MEKLTGKRLFILTIGIMMSLVVFGQQVRVSGTVTDAADRQALPGVNGCQGHTYGSNDRY